jgi:hypothetical protein
MIPRTRDQPRRSSIHEPRKVLCPSTSAGVGAASLSEQRGGVWDNGGEDAIDKSSRSLPPGRGFLPLIEGLASRKRWRARQANRQPTPKRPEGGGESLPTRKRTGEPRRLRRGRSQTTRTTIRFPDQHDGSRMLRRDFIAGWGTRRVDASGARHDFSETA